MGNNSFPNCSGVKSHFKILFLSFVTTGLPFELTVYSLSLHPKSSELQFKITFTLEFARLRFALGNNAGKPN